MGSGNYGGFGNTKGDKKHELLNKLALNLKGISNKIKTNNINSNVKAMKSKYPVNKYGYFGEKGSSTVRRVIYVADPVKSANDFYQKISKKYKYEKKIKNGNLAYMDDGTIIVMRISTKTSREGMSPAVDINVSNLKVKSKLKSQKIHFERREDLNDQTKNKNKK